MELWDLYDSERRPLNRTHVRGEAFAEGEYYVCAEVWIRNSKGEFLITKRHPNKKAGNLWEFTGGGTLAGESTKLSAIRELQEETGIQTNESELQLFATYQHKNYFQDLFLLKRDIEILELEKTAPVAERAIAALAIDFNPIIVSSFRSEEHTSELQSRT